VLEVVASLGSVLLNDTLTMVLLGLYALFICSTLLFMAYGYQVVARPLEARDAAVEGTPLWDALQAERLDVDGDVWVLREAATSIAARYVLTATARLESFRMGSRFTGVALVITFFLIAIVLVTHVSHAIAPNAPPEELPKAVTLLGAKFAISALGIIAMIGHQVLATTLVGRLQRRARELVSAFPVQLEAADSWRFVIAKRRERQIDEARQNLVEEMRHTRGEITRLGEGIAERVRQTTEAVSIQGELLHAASRQATETATVERAATRAEVRRGNETATVERAATRVEVRRGNESHAAQQAWFEATAERVSTSLAASAAAIDARLEKLGSLEVSVRDIGKEVADNLGNVMRSSIGQQMCEKVEELAVRVEQVADHVEKNLRDAVGTMMSEEIGHIRASLEAVRAAVEQQGGSQVEKLIEQLRDTVSGGFQSESRGMAEALQRFAQVVPQLESQLRTLVHGLSTDMSERTSRGAELADRMLAQVAEIMPRMEQRLLTLTEGMTEKLDGQAQRSSETTTTLLGQVSALIATLEQQQSTVNTSIAQMSDASAEGARRMVEGVTAAADARIVEITERAASDLATTFSGLREATSLATSAHADVQRAGADAQNTVAAVVREAERLIADMGAVRRDAAEHTQRALALAREVGSMGETLRAVSQEAAKQTELARATISEQTVLQGKQQETLSRLELVMPKLFETYGKNIQQQAETLALSWDKQAASVKQVMDRVGGDFAEGVQDLGDAVDRLEKSLGQKRPSA
jgi:hypothetical protein